MRGSGADEREGKRMVSAFVGTIPGNGNGWVCTNPSAGSMTVYFVPPFNAPPNVTVSPSTGGSITAAVASVTKDSMLVETRNAGTLQNWGFWFSASGR